MNTITVNYIIQNNINEERIKKILEGCSSSKNNVSINFYDYSISKEIGDKTKKINPDVDVYEEPFEERDRAKEIISARALSWASSVATVFLDEIVILNPNSLDEIDFDAFDEEQFGCIYSDYYSGSKNKIHAFLRSFPLPKNSPIPLLIFSTLKLITYIGQENRLATIFGKYASIHVPKALCCVINE